jgi:transcriptional regulator with XRE-family HTH domain
VEVNMDMHNNILAVDGPIEAQEDLVIATQYFLHDLMLERGVTRAELARRVGISKARLTQLFKPNANPTLRTLAELFHAIGETVRVVPACEARGYGKGECIWTEEADTDEIRVRGFQDREAIAAFLDAERARPSRVAFVETATNDNQYSSLELAAA